jgi:oxygen-independent coproporphyrinogen-3 oxidase
MAGVYLSFPFCAQKCTYCNFASGVFGGELERAYLEALHAEIRSADWPWTPATVYLGGGTPSQLGGGELERLLAAVPGRPWREATLEAAPGGIDEEQARGWTRAGLTRVSLGVQSFVDAELRRTGRRHDAATVAREIGALRRAGIEEFNLDLIAGLPGQTRAGWEESLDWIGRLEAPHVSVYMLEVDDDSRLGREIRLGGARYGARDVPSEDEIADFYERAVERLAVFGLARYEISNFARPGSESLHNLKYWRREPYFGFGADAHSFDGRWRWQNVETAHDYVARFRSGASPSLERNEANAQEERFFVGLRLAGGVEPVPEDWTRFRAPLTRFLEAGLLERQGSRVRLTARGVLLSNEVFQEFLLP